MKKRVLSICLIVALAAIAVVGASLAYFTDTDANTAVTVSLGEVDIELDGTIATPANQALVANQAIAGADDLNVTVGDDSNDAYVRVNVTFAPAELADALVMEVDEDVWDVDDDGDGTYTFTYMDALSAGDETGSPFDSLAVDPMLDYDVDNDEYYLHTARGAADEPEGLGISIDDSMSITVTAEAVQADQLPGTIDDGVDAFAAVEAVQSFDLP